MVQIIESPCSELVEMICSALTASDALTLEEWHERLTTWNMDEDNKYKDTTGFSMMVGKIKSTMLHGSPHSVGVMYNYYTTAGRLAATVGHYANLKRASVVDVIGCLAYMPEARCSAISLKVITTREEDLNRFLFIVKLEGSHSIAEDGGRVAALQKGFGNGANALKNWNQWEKGDKDKKDE